jgi:hypothetical protein
VTAEPASVEAAASKSRMVVRHFVLVGRALRAALLGSAL